MHVKLWFRLITFLVLVVAVDRTLYLLLSAGFNRIEVGDTGGFVNAAIRAQADVVVVGSSRARGHYDVDVLRQAYQTSVRDANRNGQRVGAGGRGVVQ